MLAPTTPLFWLCLAVLVWPVLWLSILAHEVGHVLAGRGTGFYIGAWGLGSGKPFFVFPAPSRAALCRFFFCRDNPFTGLTGAFFPALFPTRAQAASFLLGGILANLVLIFVGIALLAPAFPLGIMIAGVNGLLCAMALLPHKHGLTSDGSRLFALLAASGTRLAAISPSHALSHHFLWQALHAPTLARFATLSAAAAALDLGDLETAAHYLFQEDHLPQEMPCQSAYEALLHGLWNEASGDNRAAAERFSQATDAYERLGYHAAAHLAKIYRAGSDKAMLTSLATAPLCNRFPALRTIATGRLLATLSAEATPDAAALATALARFQNARLDWRDTALDARSFAQAAIALRRSGDTASATSFEEQARAAIAKVEAAIGDDPKTLLAYQRHMSALLSVPANHPGEEASGLR